MQICVLHGVCSVMWRDVCTRVRLVHVRTPHSSNCFLNCSSSMSRGNLNTASLLRTTGTRACAVVGMGVDAIADAAGVEDLSQNSRALLALMSVCTTHLVRIACWRAEFCAVALHVTLVCCVC